MATQKVTTQQTGGASGSTTDHPAQAEWRRQRRAYVRAAHPDLGGDPDLFRAGLAAFDQSHAPGVHADRPRVVVVRRRRLPTRLADLLSRLSSTSPPHRRQAR